MLHHWVEKTNRKCLWETVQKVTVITSKAVWDELRFGPLIGLYILILAQNKYEYPLKIINKTKPQFISFQLFIQWINRSLKPNYDKHVVPISKENRDDFELRCLDDKGNETISIFRKFWISLAAKFIIFLSEIVECLLIPVETNVWWSFQKFTQ